MNEKYETRKLQFIVRAFRVHRLRSVSAFRCKLVKIALLIFANNYKKDIIRAKIFGRYFFNIISLYDFRR